MEHNCKHEADISSVIIHCKNMAGDIHEIKETNQNIYKILNGNGAPGLVTRLAVLESEKENDKRNQPSVKAVMIYGSVGGGLTVILGMLLQKFAG